MALQETGTAPYAPTHAVTAALEAYRQNGTTLNHANLLRLQVPESIIPRTIQTLKILDLLTEAGEPTQALIDFKQAPSDTYREKLAETLRVAYAPVFQIVGPNVGEKTPEQVVDAFRLYTPDSLRKRMANLFLGLCEYVGIVESAPARKPGPKTNGKSTPRQAPPRQSQQVDKQRGTPPPTPPTPPAPGSDPLISAYFDKLPPSGATWAAAERDQWLEALKHIFQIVYKEPEGSS